MLPRSARHSALQGAAALALFACTANAEAAAPPGSTIPRTRGAQTGFFLQGGIGYTYAHLSREFTGYYNGHSSDSVSGLGSEILLGAGVGAGFVLGVGLETLSGSAHLEHHWQFGSPTSTKDWHVQTGDTDGRMFAPNVFMQKYFGNFFLRGSFGGAFLDCDDVGDIGCGSSGMAFGGALGYDVPMSRWGLGVLVGFRGSPSSYTDSSPEQEGTRFLSAFTAKITGTYF